jgi:hypothetical protein
MLAGNGSTRCVHFICNDLWGIRRLGFSNLSLDLLCKSLGIFRSVLDHARGFEHRAQNA